MKVNLILTNTYLAASDKIMSLLSDVDKCDINTKHIVIVPDTANFNTEQQVLDATCGSFNIEVYTFSRLAHKLTACNNYLNMQGCLLLLDQIIMNNADKLTCFTKGNDNAGFVKSIYDVISQLRYCNIKPSQLLNLNVDQTVKGKIDDICLLYTLYTEKLANSYVDSAMQLQMLIDAIPSSDLLSNCHIYLKDFDNLSAQELSIIGNLVSCCKSVTLAIVYDKTKQYIYNSQLYCDILDLVKSLNVTPTITTINSDTTTLTQHINNNLYKASKTRLTLPNKDSLVLYQASDVADEVERLVSYIAYNTRNNNMRYRDFAVVCPNITNYELFINRCCDKYQIPRFVDAAKPLSQHCLSQFALDLCNMYVTNFSSESLLSFAKNYFFDCPIDSVSALEVLSKKYNLNRNLLTACLSSDQLFTQAQPTIDKLQWFIKQYRLTDNVTNNLDTLRRLVNNLDNKRLFEQLAKRQDDLNLSSEVDATMQVLAKLEDAFTLFEQLLGRTTIPLTKFTKLLSHTLGNININILPDLNDCVLFTTVEKSRIYSCKTLAILSAAASVFPAIVSDTKLINDDNIDTLYADCKINLRPTIATNNYIAKFNAYQLLQQTHCNLYLSYPIQSNNDKLLPSNIILELQKIFTIDGVDDYPIDTFSCDNPYIVYTRQAARLDLVKDMRNYIDNIDSLRLADVYYALNTDLSAYLFEGSNLSNITDGKQLFIKSNTTSVSRVECFYRCPYRHFLQYGLKIKVSKVAEFNVADIGTIIHAILETYTKQFIVADQDDATTTTIVNNIFNDIIKNGVGDITPEYIQGLLSTASVKQIFIKINNEVVNLCIAIKKQVFHSKFKPTYFEFDFSKDKKTMTTVTLKDGTVLSLNGKIDRIDVLDNMCLVIDYKSGKTTFNEAHLNDGSNLQLCAYLAICKNQLGLQPVGLFYVLLANDYGKSPLTYSGRLTDDINTMMLADDTLASGKSQHIGNIVLNNGKVNMRSSIPTSQEVIDQYPNIALTRIKEACDSMLDGDVSARPLGESCKFCDYKSICSNNDLLLNTTRSSPKFNKKNIQDSLLYKE